MSQAFITRCPNCGTAFEVSDRELSMAEGIVRCGQCRHVFTATDFAVDAADDELPDFARQDDASVDDLSENLRFTFRDATTAADEELPDEDALFDDETGVEEIQAQQRAERQLTFSEDFLRTGQRSDAFADEPRGDRAEPLPSAAADDDAMHDDDDGYGEDLGPLILDDEPEPESTTDTETGPATDTDDTDEYPRIDAQRLADADLDSAFSALDDEPLAAAADAAANPDRHAPLHSKLQRLAASPVEMPIHDTRSRLRRDWPWLVLGVLALVGLLAQYTAYRFEALAHDGRFRGSLATACRLLGCELPPEQDLHRLQTSNLIIRSHPTLQSALMADFILSNEAPFDQPLPSLLLQFSDAQGQAMAQRLIRPDDYLAGEMAGARRLPARQSVHVSLELLDPGPSAVAYALQVMPDP